jgi:hypothetical protein
MRAHSSRSGGGIHTSFSYSSCGNLAVVRPVDSRFTANNISLWVRVGRVLEDEGRVTYRVGRVAVV